MCPLQHWFLCIVISAGEGLPAELHTHVNTGKRLVCSERAPLWRWELIIPFLGETRDSFLGLRNRVLRQKGSWGWAEGRKGRKKIREKDFSLRKSLKNDQRELWRETFRPSSWLQEELWLAGFLLLTGYPWTLQKRPSLVSSFKDTRLVPSLVPGGSRPWTTAGWQEKAVPVRCISITCVGYLGPRSVLGVDPSQNI